MKCIALLITLFFFTSSIAQKNTKIQTDKDFQFVELNYGLADIVRDSTAQLANSPTGTHGFLSGYELTKVTDSVLPKIKANFGVVYMIKAIDTTDIDVVIEWIYPKKITNYKGQKFLSVKYTTQRPTNTPSGSSYTLDEPYEIVKGNWIINIYLKDKLLYTKTFILY